MISKTWAQMVYLPPCPKYKAHCLGSCERFSNCYIAMPVQMPEQCSPMKNLTEVNEPGVHLGSICLISTWTSDLSNLWNSSIANRVDLGCGFPMGPSPAHWELQPLQANLFTATSLNSDIYLNCFFLFYGNIVIHLFLIRHGFAM